MPRTKTPKLPVEQDVIAPQPPQMQPAPQMPVAMPPHIDAAAFLRVRESVVASLNVIQDMLRNFTADYMRQTGMLLGDPAAYQDMPAVDPQLNMYGAMGMMPMNMMPGGMVLVDKKERKKRRHDKEAPKRPLTPYFLYMKTARPIIASDLGENSTKGAVQIEGQRRWSLMSAAEKEGWTGAYQYNLRLYNGRVHAYKNGDATAPQMTDEDALKYCEEHGITEVASAAAHAAAVASDAGEEDQAAIAEQLGQTSTHADEATASEAEPEPEPVPEPAEEPVKPTTPAPKTPKARTSKKRKSEAMAATEPAAPTPAPAAAATPAVETPAAVETASPEKKKAKRASKAAPVAAAAAAEPAAAAEEEKPKKSRAKKAKTG